MPNDSTLDRIRTYAGSLLPKEEGGHESTESIDSFVESAAAWASRGGKPLSNEQKDAARTAYVNLISHDVKQADVDPLEAIILPGLRPVGDVHDGILTLPKAGDFADLVMDTTLFGRMNSALQSIGCI